MVSDNEISEFINVKIKDETFLKGIISETMNVKKTSKAIFFGTMKRAPTTMSSRATSAARPVSSKMKSVQTK